MTAELVVIGGGRMGEALVAGLLDAGWAGPEQLIVAEPSAPRREVLAGPGGLGSRWPGLAILEPSEVPAGAAKAALVAVKPGDVPAACATAGRLGVARVLSVAAGVTLEALRSAVAAGSPPVAEASSAAATAGGPRGRGPVVLRAMPNTPALIGAGAAALAAGPDSTAEDLDWGESVLASVGSVVRVPEPLLDAVTGLSGSGPAYVFVVAEAMIDAGVLVGLPRPVAAQLTAQTLLGAARMLSETGETAESLRAAVTSPAGTTAAGLRALESGGLRSALIEAVVAATERSRALGG